MAITHANLDGSFETMPTEVVTHDIEVMRFQVSGAQIVPGIRGRGRRGYVCSDVASLSHEEMTFVVRSGLNATHQIMLESGCPDVRKCDFFPQYRIGIRAVDGNDFEVCKAMKTEDSKLASTDWHVERLSMALGVEGHPCRWFLFHHHVQTMRSRNMVSCSSHGDFGKMPCPCLAVH